MAATVSGGPQMMNSRAALFLLRIYLVCDDATENCAELEWHTSQASPMALWFVAKCAASASDAWHPLQDEVTGGVGLM
ncbi:MAG: hypothetical protein ABSH45_14590 [Bryobacteraceae bacterium]